MNEKIADLYRTKPIFIIMLMAFIPDISAQAEAIWFGGTICVIYLVILIVWIMAAIWVYRDAESRGQSGVIWLLVVLVGGIIGLIVYFVIRSGWPEHPLWVLNMAFHLEDIDVPVAGDP